MALNLSAVLHRSISTWLWLCDSSLDRMTLSSPRRATLSLANVSSSAAEPVQQTQCSQQGAQCDFWCANWSTRNVSPWNWPKRLVIMKRRIGKLYCSYFIYSELPHYICTYILADFVFPIDFRNNVQLNRENCWVILIYFSAFSHIYLWAKIYPKCYVYYLPIVHVLWKNNNIQRSKRMLLMILKIYTRKCQISFMAHSDSSWCLVSNFN